MSTKFKTVLGYTGATLTVALAVLTPFVLMGAFTRAVAHAGLRVDERYSGGTVARTVDRGGYRVEIYHEVAPQGLRHWDPFVQVDFGPAARLPATVDETIDLDGDGQPDVRVRFRMGTNNESTLSGEVTGLNARYGSFTSPATKTMARIVAHVGERVVVRVPVKQ
jgi:hypothetical protein